MQEGDPVDAIEKLKEERKPLRMADKVERLLYSAAEMGRLTGKAWDTVMNAAYAARELQRSIVNISKIYRLTADILERKCGLENKSICAHRVKQLCDYLVQTRSDYTVEIDGEEIKQVIPAIHWIRRIKENVDLALAIVDIDNEEAIKALVETEYILDDLETAFKQDCLWLRKVSKEILSDSSGLALEKYADQLRKSADFYV